MPLNNIRTQIYRVGFLSLTLTLSRKFAKMIRRLLASASALTPL